MTLNDLPPDPASDEMPKEQPGSAASEGQSTPESVPPFTSSNDAAVPERLYKPPSWSSSDSKPTPNPKRTAKENGTQPSKQAKRPGSPAVRPDTQPRSPMNGKPASQSERPFTAAKRPAELNPQPKKPETPMQRLRQFVESILTPPQDKPTTHTDDTIPRRPVPPFITAPDSVTDLSGTPPARRPYIPSSAAVTDLSGTPPLPREMYDAIDQAGETNSEKPAAIPTRPAFHLDTTETIALYIEAADAHPFVSPPPSHPAEEAPPRHVPHDDILAPYLQPADEPVGEEPLIVVPPFALPPRPPKPPSQAEKVTATVVEAGRAIADKWRGLFGRLFGRVMDWFNQPVPHAPMPPLRSGRIRFLQLVWWVKLVDTADATQPAPNLLFRALSSPIFLPMALMNLVVAIGLWGIALPRMHPENLNNYGLVSITPPAFYIAIVLVVAGFVYTLVFHPTRTTLMMLYTFAITLILCATTAIVYASPRFVWTYKHIGVADYISVFDTVNNKIDVYHSWPGFFALTSLIADATGSMTNLKYIVGWSHFVFNISYIGGLLLIYRALTRDPRLIWGGIWFFLITNWVGQDYFAPQAFAFGLALLVYGFVLTGMRARHKGALANFSLRFIPQRVRWLYRWLLHPRRQYPSMEEFRDRYWIIFSIVILVLASIIGSHQLTPFMILLALGTMLVTRLSNAYLVVVLLLAMTLFWYNVPAAEYMRTSDELATIGDVSNNVSSSVRDASLVSPELRVSMFSSRGLTALAMGLAGLGFVRRFRNGYRDYVLIGLMLSPFPMFFLQSYGGEMLFRTVLFASPWFCFLMAALFFPTARWGRSIVTCLAVIVFSGSIIGMYMFAQFGREKSYYFTVDEIEAVTWLWDEAAPGSYILSATFNYASNYTYRYNLFDLTSLDGQGWFSGRDPIVFDTLEIRDLMLYNNPTSSYYIYSTGQIRHSDLMNIYPVGTLEAFDQRMRQSPDFEIVYENADVTIYKLRIRQDEAVDKDRAQAAIADERFTQRLQILEQRFRRERQYENYLEALREQAK